MISNPILASQDYSITGVVSTSTLVVFDSRVSDIDTLTNALLPGAMGFTIDAQDDSLESITQLLAATGAKYLSVVAHGEPGMIHLGKMPINIQQLQSQSRLLQQWNIQQISLYSCEVAQGDIGKDLIYQLSELTGATVAASATKTGDPALGGNWDLAVTTSEVTAPIVFKSSALQTYQAVLAGVSFSTTNFALPQAGNGPDDIAVGDFNGDGILDIATERYANNTNNVLILLGNGAGSFAAPRNFAIGNGSFYTLAVGDFNGDGKLDVVTANTDIASLGGTTVSVLLGDGAGNIGAAKKFTTGGSGASAPWKVVVGDFNNDGKLDIATANKYGNQYGGNFSVLLGDGIGGFSAPTTFSTPGSDGIYTIALGDFNKDGKLDAVTSKYVPFVGYYLSVFTGNGAGGFSSPTDIPVGNTVSSSIAIADFNGDGNLDVATNGQAVSVLLGDGFGGFGAATNVAVGSYTVQAGDFNGDGIIDLAGGVGNITSIDVSVVLGNGSGSFGAATNIAVGSSSAFRPSLAVGDFNNDGKLDFAAANYNDKNVVVGLNTSIQTPINSSTARNDFNGDKNSDILWRNTDGSIALWQMNSSTVTPSSVGSLTSDWKIAGTGDFNSDRKSDILLANTNGAVATWQMNGSTVTKATTIGTLTTGWSIAGTGDLNGDGTADVILTNTNGTVAEWQINNSSVTAAKTIGTLTAGWSIAGTADFNGDGKTDILFQNTNGTIALWQMNGATVASTSVIGNTTSDWKIAGVADFNGDGKADILWRNTNGSVAEWQMDGSKVTATSVIGSATTDWKIAGTGDYNGDRNADILWRNDLGTVATWQLNGSTILAAGATSIPTAPISWQIAAPIL
jgi:hypothetical protein